MIEYNLNYCPYCGKKLGANNGKKPNFCSYCGQKFKTPIISIEGKIQCTICHNFIYLEKDTTIKCSFCGSIYHSSCVSSWLMKYNSCPMCQNVFLNPTLINYNRVRKK